MDPSEEAESLIDNMFPEFMEPPHTQEIEEGQGLDLESVRAVWETLPDISLSHSGSVEELDNPDDTARSGIADAASSEQTIVDQDASGEPICQHGWNVSHCLFCSEECIHKLQRYFCKECRDCEMEPSRPGNGTSRSKCSHGKLISTCVQCGGPSICQHGVRKAYCDQCGGWGLCSHKVRKQYCKICLIEKKANVFDSIPSNSRELPCPHGKRRRDQCRDCLGTDFCEHDRIKYECRDCKGSNICEHNRRKDQCKKCNPLAFCPHKRMKKRCEECKGSQRCQEHNVLKYHCFPCGGKGACKHKSNKRNCKECDGSAYCKCGKWKYKCKVYKAVTDAAKNGTAIENSEHGDRPKVDITVLSDSDDEVPNGDGISDASLLGKRTRPEEGDGGGL